jgi:hypothetical protein
MASSLAELRKNRGNFEDLMKEVEKIASPAGERKGDERFWSLTVDKAGNGQAIIRFLPATKGEDFPWVRYWSHGFQGPSGRWYIENSLTTFNLPDPVSEMNSELWKTGIESNKQIARDRKRKLTYISNILIVKDSANPENEGKVFLFKFGKKIFDKIKDLTQPQFEDEKAINPFDLWEGANFKLKAKKVEGYRNYDKSEFDGQSAVADADEAIEKVWNMQYPLSEFVDKKNFKSYEELKAKLDLVLKGGPSMPKAAEMSEDRVKEPPSEKPRLPKSAPIPSFANDDDDEENYFSKLAED